MFAVLSYHFLKTELIVDGLGFKCCAAVAIQRTGFSILALPWPDCLVFLVTVPVLVDLEIRPFKV